MHAYNCIRYASGHRNREPMVQPPRVATAPWAQPVVILLTLVYTESPRGMVAFGGRPGPLRTPPEASQAAKLAPHGPLGMAKTDIYFSHQ
jgi:hypothetical protein